MPKVKAFFHLIKSVMCIQYESHYAITLNPFPNNKFWTLPNWKSLQTTNSNLTEMAESYPNWQKSLWEKEKLLITSNFSFSHSVLKRLVLQTCKNLGLFGKGLTTQSQLLANRSKDKGFLKAFWEKEEYAVYKHFLLFQKCLDLCQRQIHLVKLNLICHHL